jgi:hypothetical protein
VRDDALEAVTGFPERGHRRHDFVAEVLRVLFRVAGLVFEEPLQLVGRQLERFRQAGQTFQRLRPCLPVTPAAFTAATLWASCAVYLYAAGRM